jgi:hypothetical protein
MVEKSTEQKGNLLSDKLFRKNAPKENSDASVVNAAEGSAACPIQGKGWLGGALGMAVCCAVPLVIFAATVIFGLSLGAITSGALSLLAILACPVGMFLVMRMMMKNKN